MADAVFAWLQESLPQAGRHRLYFDHGNQGLNALYAPFQGRMDAIAKEKAIGRGWITWPGPTPGPATTRPRGGPGWSYRLPFCSPNRSS